MTLSSGPRTNGAFPKTGCEPSTSWSRTGISSSWVTATRVSPRSYGLYPYQSRIPHTSNVYQSLGIAQVRWTPDGSLHPGTEPLRWESTAFNLDEQAATLRFYYDNPSGARSPGAIQPTLRVKSGRALGRGTIPTHGVTPGKLPTSELSAATSVVAFGPLPASWAGHHHPSRAG